MCLGAAPTALPVHGPGMTATVKVDGILWSNLSSMFPSSRSYGIV